MATIVAIVEGHGEEEAVPILLRRIATAVAPTGDIEVLPPIRVDRCGVVSQGELERAVELAARRSGGDGSILILLDADDDCPAELGPDLLQRARAARPDRVIRVVLAKAEYEAWFLAAAASIAGRHDIDETVPPDDPEGIRDANEVAEGADASRSIISSDAAPGRTHGALRSRCRAHSLPVVRQAVAGRECVAGAGYALRMGASPLGPRCDACETGRSHARCRR